MTLGPAGLALLLVAVPVSAAPPRMNPAHAALLERLTWRPDATDAAAIVQMGTTRWLDRQSAPHNIRLMVGDYERGAIRPRALGRFRDLLESTLRAPAMVSRKRAERSGHINENYAGEIMELHTMGVGSGYSQKDVQELARILTGVGIDAKPDDPRSALSAAAT